MNNKKKRKKNTNLSYSVVFSSFSSAWGVWSLLSASVISSECACWGASEGWAGMWASSTKEIGSIAGSSSTFSRVVSIGACSVTSKAWSGASITGCSSWAASAIGSVAMIVSAGASICVSIRGAASTVSTGASSTAIVGCSIGAAS